MQEIFYNNSNLTKEEIDKTVIRVKAILINDSQEDCWQTRGIPFNFREDI